MLRRNSAVFHQLFNESRHLRLHPAAAQIAPANSEEIPISAGGIQRAPPKCRIDIELGAVFDEKLDDFC